MTITGHDTVTLHPNKYLLQSWLTLRTLIWGGFLTDQLDAILEHRSNNLVAPYDGNFQQPMNTRFTFLVVSPNSLKLPISRKLS